MDIWIYVALIAIAAGIVKGVSGFGSSLVSIPLLSVVLGIDYIKEIVVVMITFNLLLNSLLLVEHKGFKPSNLKNVWVISLFGALFTIVGVVIFTQVDSGSIKLIAGILLIVSVLVRGLSFTPLLKGKTLLNATPLFKAITGSLSGIGNGIASIDGPPVVFYLMATNAKQVTFKNTLAAHFLAMGIIAVITHIIIGSFTVDIILITLIMTVFTIAGLYIGIRLGRKLNEQVFDIVIMVILLALATYYLIQ